MGIFSYRGASLVAESVLALLASREQEVYQMSEAGLSMSPSAAILPIEVTVKSHLGHAHHNKPSPREDGDVSTTP